MKLVKEWSTIICLAAIVCTILELICPNGKMEKIVKFVLSSFMLCAFISPIANTVPKISLELSNSSKHQCDPSFKEKISKQTLNVCRDNIVNLAKKELGRHNIKAKKINVLMDTDDSGSISIIKVVVYLNEKESHKDVKKFLEDNLGIETEIICGSE